jgi:hypothetical protein
MTTEWLNTISHASRRLPLATLGARLSNRSASAHTCARWQCIDWRTAAAFGLPLILYLLTLAPTVYNLDSAELTTAAVTGGLVHATGYPLYLALGRVWSWLPIGDAGYRLNAFSALNGALTIALAERILRRLDVGPWAAFGALGLLACAPFFWALSLIAEVYTLHTALLAALIILLLRWADRPTPARLALAALTMGLGAGNHAATVLLLPGCLFFVLTTAPRRALALHSLLPALLALLAGLSIYLYLPLCYAARPSLNYVGHYDATGSFISVDLHTVDGLSHLIPRHMLAHHALAYEAAEAWRELGHFGAELWRAFLAIGVGPGMLGIAMLLRREWRLAGMLLLMFVCHSGFYVNYRVVDKDTMFLPAYVVWALWAGVGYQGLVTWVADATRHGLGRPWDEVVLRLVMVGGVLMALGSTWSLVDLSQDRSARTHGETVLGLVEPNALVLGWWDTVPVVEYLQLVEGQRPDVQAINRFLIAPNDLRQLIQREVTRRPVYVDSLPAGLPNVQAESAGPLYRLRPRE